MGVWGKQRPNGEGFYWYRSRNTSNVARVCHVDRKGFVTFTDGVVREVHRLRGEWSQVEYPREANGVRYSVRRCTGPDKGSLSLFGSYHGSHDGSSTLCGLSLNGEGYYITHNDFDGPITCRKCRGKL